jgi:prolyl-tRNA editing enzyme YbaK/EbsC (Cys-tRNA(Pro) deacylase)
MERIIMREKQLTTFMHENMIQGEMVALDQDVSTVETAAQALDVSPDAIVKSVVFIADSEPVLVIANGLARIDSRKLADHLGITRKRVKLAGAEAVLEVTGFNAGSVPPFGHKSRLRTIIDSRVLVQPVIYAGSGRIEAVLRITPAEIVRVTKAESVHLTGMG